MLRGEKCPDASRMFALKYRVRRDLNTDVNDAVGAVHSQNLSAHSPLNNAVLGVSVGAEHPHITVVVPHDRFAALCFLTAGGKPFLFDRTVAQAYVMRCSKSRSS